MICFENLSKKFGTRTLFKDFTYNFPSSGIVAIVGESGSGKSTLLNLISGLDFSYQGTAKVLGKNLSSLSNNELANFRLKNIGYVFQNFNLLNLETVYNNIYFPLDTISAAKQLIKKKRVNDAIELVGLSTHAKKRVNQLSGGEKQRVAIARSIINDPEIILCDEPTGALDEKNGTAIFDLLNRISKTKLVIIATHDLEGIQNIANVILEIKNQRIIVKNQRIVGDIEKPLLIGRGKTKSNPRVSLKFKIVHSFYKMKAKKYRSLILNLMLSLSLTGVGLSFIISDSVSSKVNDAFKTILNGNQIILSTKNENENTFSNSYSANYKSVYKIYEKYQYHIEGIGVNYLVNFEDFFRDKNEFFISSTSRRINIDSFSIRNINDFKWLDGSGTNIFYPENVEGLDDDQIVLGLTYNDMVNICYQLQIQRNYTSLGHYIYEKGLLITLSVENSSWEYDDEQIFSVVAICESSEPCIYHSNYIWNESVFEEMMRFPCDDDDEHYYPWEMYKIYYLKTKQDPSVFLNAAIYDEDLVDYVFERANYNYNPSLCKYGSVCDEQRIYLYIADKSCVNGCEVNRLKKEIPEIGSYYFTSEFGYASYASNLFAGFSKNVFISPDEEQIIRAIDADLQINNETNLMIDLPENIVQGNYLKSLGDGLRFSTIPGTLKYGRMPSNLNEIVISEGLAKKFDEKSLCIGKYLTFAGEIEECADKDGNVYREYNSAKVLVVGVTSETKNYVYHDSNWSISFFRDKLGVSNFLLIPKAVVFEFDNDETAKIAYEKMLKNNFEYKVTNPLNELSENIDSTLEYANTILLAFSCLSTIISILLLGTVIMLNILESKNEVQLFKFLGIRKSEINSIFTIQSILQGAIAFLISSVELLVVDTLISYILGDYLNIGFKFSLNSKPVLIILVMALSIPFLISKIMLVFLNNTKN